MSGPLLRGADRATLRTRGGKLQQRNCASGCCSQCLVYYKANPCGAVTAPVDPCDPSGTPPVPPPPIYVNSLAQCFGRPIIPGDIVVVDGRCYTISGDRFKRAVDTCNLPPIPPDGRIVDQIDDCARDCRDPKCVVFTSPWGTAEQCDTSIEFGPPIFFCRKHATRCVYLGGTPAPGMRPRCFKISPNSPGGVPGRDSQIYTEGQIASGVPTCCECTTGLGGDSNIPCFRCPTYRETKQPNQPAVITPGPPCCFDRRTPCSMTVAARFFIGDLASNSTLYVVDPQTISCTGGTVYATLFETENGHPLPPRTVPAAVYDNMGEQMCPPQPPTFGFLEGGSRQYDIRQDCDGVKITARDTQGSGGDATLSASIAYNHAAGSPPCAGGCAGSGPPSPVPFAQWPPGAKLVALRKQAGDKGIGSTIEREIGRTGVLFKAACKAAGFECGCDARRDKLDAKYPY